MDDMIYLLVLFLIVARIVGPKARVANEASKNLRGRGNLTFVAHSFARLTKKSASSSSSIVHPSTSSSSIHLRFI
jgi:hypothetical protein